MPSQKRYTFFLILTSIVCILALYLYRHRQGHTGRIDNLIISMTGTMQKQFFYFGHGTRSIWEHYFLLVNAKKQNEELQKEIEELRSKVAALKDIELENGRLRESLQFKDELKKPMISAHIVAHDVSNDFVGLRIDKGSDDGIQTGMGVVAAGGVVGRIKTVTAKYSDIITLIDPLSNIDVLIQRTRVRGILSGQSKQLSCKIKYVDKLEDVAVDDLVTSTDFGGVFPRGLLVGYVNSVIPSSSGVLQTVTVKPAVDVYRLEEVLVVFPESQPKKVSE